MSERNLMPPQCQGGSGCTCCGTDCDCGCVETCPAYNRLSKVYVPPRNQGKAMMNEQINPGDGWRLLGPDEVVREGDEPWHRFAKRWMNVPMDVPYTAKAYPAVRRRIPTKPEPFGVLFYEWRVENSKAVIRIDMEKAEFNSKQARELANWLTQYADWQESQNDS